MHPSKPDSVRDRVAYVASLMRSAQWARGKSAPPIAEAWGLSVVTVEHYATEASRIVLAEVNDPELVSINVGLAFEAVIGDALEESRAPDTEDRNAPRRVVIQAGQAWAQLAGAIAPTRHQVDVSVSQMSADELRLASVEAIRVLAQDDPALLLALNPTKGDDNGDQEK